MVTAGPADLFVGRAEELRQLDAARAAAAQGHGGLVVVVGDAGVGKTRLVTEFAARATAAGARVLWGRCREIPGSPPYWPWSQALGAYLPGPDVGVPEADLPYLAHLAPGLPGGAAPLAGEQDHFRLFDAVSRTVRAAAAGRPLVVILDDLHAADLPSLRLLHFLTPDLPGSPVLVVGTVRPATDPASSAAAAALGDALRPASRIVLGGLSREETDVLLAGWSSAPEVLTAVWEATDGNPFFALETVRLLAAEGRLTGLGAAGLSVPEGVRHTLRQRLAPLGDHAREVMETAAVIGVQFDAALLAAATGLPPDRVLDAVGEAIALGVLAQPRIDLGTYRFSHALIRETLYGDLAGNRRAELHGRVGAALEARYGSSVEAHLHELADHFLRALPLGDPARAADLAVQAGRAALTEFAYERAVRLLHTGVDLLAAEAAADPVTYAEAHLALGDALLRDGRPDASRATFARAAELAREHGLPRVLAHAALGHGGQWVATEGRADPAVIALLESAVDALPDGEDDLGVRLLARLAEELNVTEPERAARLSAQALDRARQTGLPEPLGRALLARVSALWRPVDPDLLRERLRLDDEAIRIAERSGAAELELDARAWRVLDLLEAGDVVAADAQIAAFGRTARVLCQPFYRWFAEVFAAMRALMQGRYDDAERHADAALAVAGEGGGRRELEQVAESTHAVQRLVVARERGADDGTTDAPGESALARYPHQPAWRAAAGLWELAQGNEPRARVHYDVLRAGGFGTVLGPTGSLFALCLTAELAAGLADADGARALEERLAPLAGRHVVIGPPAIAYLGVVDHYLGLLSAARGDHPAAASHLAEAVRHHGAVGAVPWVCRTQYELARVHLTRGRDGDTAQAGRLLDDARRLATELGMAPLVARITAVDDGAPVAPRPPTVPDRATFRREGEVWAVSLGGESTRVVDVKGMRYLHRLLGSPGREFHVLDLSSATRRGTTSAAAAAADGMRVDDGSLGPLLDAQAKAAYRRRLEDLRAEVADAEELGHADRAASAQEEIDALAHELARAVGLGGRDRPTGTAAERARVNVSRAIRAAISRIAEGAPSLGHHLSTSVRTGVYCVYTPDPAATPAWQLSTDDRRSSRTNARSA